jgi:uncharacterized protein (DUF433 family)
MAGVAAGRLDFQDRIIQDPDILVGKPVVKATRIPSSWCWRSWPRILT